MHKLFLQIILFPLVFTMGVPCFGNGVGLPDVIEDGAELVEVYSSGHFFEGPVWDPATAKLYFTINSSNQILRLDSPGSATVWMENTQGINGMCLSLEGKLLCAQVTAHQVPSYTIGADGPENEIILASDPSWNQPNDVRQSITGDIYFTDPNFGTTSLSAVYHLATNGTVTKIITEMSLPNGLVVSNDGNTLYVGNSYEKLWRSYPINPDGSVGTGSVFFNPTTTNNSDPDGMTIDEEGNLYFTGLGGIWVVKPTGELNGFIPITEFASNVTFGDADYKTLYITCDGKVYSLRMKVSGKPISEPSPVSEFKKY